MRYVFDDYLLDTQRYEIWHKGECRKPRPKVFQMLAYLIRHRDRVVSKDELPEHLWPNQFVSDGTLNACLMAVRQAIGDNGKVQRRIQTLHKRGYRFVAALEEQEDRPLGRATASMEHPVQGAEALTQDQASVTIPLTQPPGVHEAFVPHPPADVRKRFTSHTLDQEHKQVTVLCCVLAGAASLPSRLGAEAMHHLMQAFFARVQATVERYEGSVMHDGGDGFMALFGAPVAQEDHARRAVLAALELQQQLCELEMFQGQQHREPLAIRMGLHTGPVVIGTLGHDPPQPYTAVGDTTHLAMHLQCVALSGGVLVSEAIYRLVQEEVQGQAWRDRARARHTRRGSGTC